MKAFLGSDQRLNEAFAQHGFAGRPLLPSAVPQVVSLGEERLAEALASIRSLERILLSSADEQNDLLDTQTFMDLTFRELGLTYSDEFVSKLGPDDVVDGYNLANLQIFRNFRFIQICGYNLHDVLLHDWPTLFERSQVITQQILTSAAEVIETGRTVSLEHIPRHYMKERLSEAGQIVTVRFKQLGPIFAAAGQPAGIIASSEAEIVDDNPADKKLRFI